MENLDPEIPNLAIEARGGEEDPELSEKENLEVFEQIQAIINNTVQIERVHMELLMAGLKEGKIEQALAELDDLLVAKHVRALRNLFSQESEIDMLLQKLDKTSRKRKQTIGRLIKLINLNLSEKSLKEIEIHLEDVIEVFLNQGPEVVQEMFSKINIQCLLELLSLFQNDQEILDLLDDDSDEKKLSLQLRHDFEVEFRNCFKEIEIEVSALNLHVEQIKEDLDLDKFLEKVEDDLKKKHYKRLEENIKSNDKLTSLFGILKKEKEERNSFDSKHEDAKHLIDFKLDLLRTLEGYVPNDLPKEKLNEAERSLLKSQNLHDFLSIIEDDMIKRIFKECKEKIEQDKKVHDLLEKLRPIPWQNAGVSSARQQIPSFEEESRKIEKQLLTLFQAMKIHLPNSLDDQVLNEIKDELFKSYALDQVLNILEDQLKGKEFKVVSQKINNDDHLKLLLGELKTFQNDARERKLNEASDQKKQNLKKYLFECFENYRVPSMIEEDWIKAREKLVENLNLEGCINYLDEKVPTRSSFNLLKTSLLQDEEIMRLMQELADFDDQKEMKERLSNHLVLSYGDIEELDSKIIEKISEQLEKPTEMRKLLEMLRSELNEKSFDILQVRMHSDVALATILKKNEIETQFADQRVLALSELIISEVKKLKMVIKTRKVVQVKRKIIQLLLTHLNLDIMLEEFMKSEEVSELELTLEQLHHVRLQILENELFKRSERYFRILKIVRNIFLEINLSDAKILSDFVTIFDESCSFEKALSSLKKENTSYYDSLYERIYLSMDLEAFVFEEMPPYPFLETEYMKLIREKMNMVISSKNLIIGFQTKLFIMDQLHTGSLKNSISLTQLNQVQRHNVTLLLKDLKEDPDLIQAEKRFKDDQRKGQIVQELLKDLGEIFPKLDLEKLTSISKNILEVGLLKAISEISLTESEIRKCFEIMSRKFETTGTYKKGELPQKEIFFWTSKVQSLKERLALGKKEDQSDVEEIISYLEKNPPELFTIKEIVRMLKKIQKRNKGVVKSKQMQEFTSVLFSKSYTTYSIHQDFFEEGDDDEERTDEDLLKQNLCFSFQFQELGDYFEKIALKDPFEAKTLYADQQAKYSSRKITIRKPDILDYLDFVRDEKELISLLRKIEKLKQEFLASKEKEILIDIENNLAPKIYEHNPELYYCWLTKNKSQDFPIQELIVKSYALNPKAAFEQAVKIASTIKLPKLTLKDFNVFSSRHSQKEQDTIIKNWVDDITNPNKFHELLPIYFNLLKRGEDWKLFGEKVYYHMSSQKIVKDLGYFQKKMLFYLLLMAGDEEFQARLLTLYGSYYPIPLRYALLPKTIEASQSSQVGLEYVLNPLVYFIAQPSLGVLSFGLGKKSISPIGKSGFLNQVFKKNFAVNEASPFHAGTIDVDFDCAFRPTRNFCIADTHGEFPADRLADFLNVFKISIIHIHSQDLKNDKIDSELKNFGVMAKKSNLSNHFVILIRDHQGEVNFEDDFKNLKSQYPKLAILTNNLANNCFKLAAICNLEKIDNQEKTVVMQKVQKLILACIEPFKDEITIEKERLLTTLFKPSDKITDIKQIHEIIKEFLKEMDKYKDDYFDEKALPYRNYLSKLRNVQIVLRTAKNDAELNKCKDLQTELMNKLKKVKATKLLKLFGEILKHPNHYLIIMELSREIRDRVLENTNSLIKERNKLQIELSPKKVEEEEKRANEDVNQNASLRGKKEALQDIQNKIEKRSLSIEVFWRELMSLYNYNKEQVTKVMNIDPIEKILHFLELGEPFELIDGDNLQFNENFLKDLFARMKGKMCNVSIIGPQSSGKSTLFNRLFGCQFVSSVGRCTRGIYLSILKINHPHYQYLMLLDTEGLQSVEKNDSEFDRKITLFCLAVSQIILINVKGDFNLPMKSLLEICTLSLHELNKAKINQPSVYFIFNQNPPTSSGKSPFIAQISTMMNDIIDANPEAESVANILRQNEDHLHPLGFAFQIRKEEKDESKGIWQEWTDIQPQSSFANECAILAQSIMGKIQERLEKSERNASQSIFSNFPDWSDMAHEIWRTIDTFPSLLEFGEVRQMKQDKELRFICHKLIDERAEKLNAEVVIADKIGATLKNNRTNSFEKLLSQRHDDICDEHIKVIQNHYLNVAKEVSGLLMAIREREKYDYDLTKRHEKNLIGRVESYEQEAIYRLRTDTLKIIVEVGKIKGLQGITDKISEFLVDPSIRESKEAASTKFDEIWNEYIEKSLFSFLNLEEHDNSMWGTIYRAYSNLGRLPILTSSEMKPFQDIINRHPQERLNEQRELEPLIKYFVENKLSLKNTFLRLDDRNETFHQEFRVKFRQPTNYFHISRYFQYTLQIQYFEHKTLLRDYVDWSFFQTRCEVILSKRISKEGLAKQILSAISSFISFGYHPRETVIERILEISNDWYVISNASSEIRKVLSNYQEFNPIVRNNSLFVLKADPQIFSVKEVPQDPWLKSNLVKIKHLPFENMNDLEREIVRFKEENPNFWILTNSCSPSFSPLNISFREGLNYCLDPYNRSIVLSTATKELKQLITNETEWLKLFRDIFEKVMKEIEVKALNVPIRANIDTLMIGSDSQSSQDEKDYYNDIASFSTDLVKNVAKKIEEKIFEYNKEILRCAYKLDMDGVGMIHLFALLVTWKTLCFASRKRLMAPIVEIKKEKEKWRNYFVSSVNNNLNEKSVSFSDRILTEYLKKLKSVILETDIKPKAIESIQAKVADFDAAKIQSAIDKNILVSGGNPDQVIDYVLHQSQWVEKDFEKMWNNLCDPLIANKKNVYQTNLIDRLKVLRSAISTIYTYLFNIHQKDDISPFAMFEIRDAQNNIVSMNRNLEIDQLVNEQANTEFLEICSRAAFHAFDDYLKKGINAQWVYKERQYCVRLKGLNDLLEPCVFLDITQEANLNANENQIPCLAVFLKNLQKLLDTEIAFVSTAELKWSYNDLGLDTIYQTYKNASVGCTENCPTCGRKCDRMGDNHIHGCDNGHQVRGMYGIKVGSTLSSKTCDEIKPDSLIMIDNNTKQMKWKDFVKNLYPGWNFTNLDPAKIQEKVLAYRKYWKDNGKIFCDYYSRLYGQVIPFSLSEDAQYYHFILALDGSGSMSGSPWTSAVKGATSFLTKLKEIENSFSGVKVSLIIFNSSAKTVASYQDVDTSLSNLLVYPGGGTCFDPPLDHAYQLISSHKNSDKHVILFYTDGGAAYPLQVMEKFKASDQRSKIAFYALSEEANPTVLHSIAREIKQYGAAEVKTNISPDMLTRELPEVLNSMFHKVI